MTEEAGAVIGINLGNSYGSIASINQHGRADVIANEDGERQLATRIAFAGEQVYIGNQATPQLVRNAPNVVDRFVNLLGLKFSELSADDKQRSSAALIDVGSDTPGFEVEINGAKTKLSVHEVAVRYLKSLFSTAKEFLSGVPIAGAVLSYPPFFSPAQMEALRKAAEEAGLVVLQLIPAGAAALVAYGLTAPGPGGKLPQHPDGELSGSADADYPANKVLDRNIVVLDVGASSTDVTVVAARAGLFSTLAYNHDASLGGTSIDDAMIEYFAKEFTKKTKVKIEPSNLRAWAKLRNEAEITKRALSASNSAHCSVESLCDGLDFSGPLNRVRLDMLARKVYDGALDRVSAALKEAQLEAAQVDEVVLVGGTARLVGLLDTLEVLFPADAGVTKLTSSIDTDQVIARGSAVQAQAIAALPKDSPERKHLLSLPIKGVKDIAELSVPTTIKAIGLVVPAPDLSKINGAAPTTKQSIVDGKLFVPIVYEKTPLPARRVVQLNAPASGLALLDFSEAAQEIHVEKIDPPAPDPEDVEDDAEPEEPEEVRTAIYKPSRPLGQLAVESKGKVQVQVVIEVNGAVHIKAISGTEAELSLPAP